MHSLFLMTSVNKQTNSMGQNTSSTAMSHVAQVYSAIRARAPLNIVEQHFELAARALRHILRQNEKRMRTVARNSPAYMKLDRLQTTTRMELGDLQQAMNTYKYQLRAGVFDDDMY